MFGKGVEVKGGKGLFIEFADIVEEDRLCGWGGDGKNAGRGVEGCEVGGVYVQHANRVHAVKVPDSDGVIEGRGDECVIAGVHGETSYRPSVPFEVAKEGVVVRSEVPDII